MLTDREWSEMDIPLKNYEVPNWWYGANNITEQDLDKPDFSKVTAISIASCTNLKAGATDNVNIKELKFYKDLSSFYIGCTIFLVLYFTIWYLLLKMKKRKSNKEITFKYEKVESINKVNSKNEDDPIINYITINYSNPELSVIELQQAMGIHERKISSIIKKKTALSFKQFLNKIRITEAKRLLLESDLNISEIALKTGYANTTHFNRVFKASEDCSPNDFRKKHKVYFHNLQITSLK